MSKDLRKIVPGENNGNKRLRGSIEAPRGGACLCSDALWWSLPYYVPYLGLVDGALEGMDRFGASAATGDTKGCGSTIYRARRTALYDVDGTERFSADESFS